MWGCCYCYKARWSVSMLSTLCVWFRREHLISWHSLFLLQDHTPANSGLVLIIIISIMFPVGDLMLLWITWRTSTQACNIPVALIPKVHFWEISLTRSPAWVDNTWAVMIVCRIRGKIVRAVQCCAVSDCCAQWYAHIYQQFLQLIVGLGWAFCVYFCFN